MPDLSSLAVLLSPVAAAPLVRWLANTLAVQFGGRPAWWGAGLAVLIEAGLSLVLAPIITPEVVARGVVYALFTFGGAFGLNEYLASKQEVKTRGVSMPRPGSWL